MPSLASATDRVNDFVIKFANVNGSGSASANELFARSLLRMGVPVSPRNIFPSNIQGLPTWYEVRVTEKGWLGRRGGVDLMVAMNPQTWDADVAEISGGIAGGNVEGAAERDGQVLEVATNSSAFSENIQRRLRRARVLVAERHLPVYPTADRVYPAPSWLQVAEQFDCNIG